MGSLGRLLDLQVKPGKKSSQLRMLEVKDTATGQAIERDTQRVNFNSICHYEGSKKKIIMKGNSIMFKLSEHEGVSPVFILRLI